MVNFYHKTFIVTFLTQMQILALLQLPVVPEVQFNAVMTDEVKTNYQTFLSSQSETE